VADPAHPTPRGSLIGHAEAVTTVAFSPDGHTAASGSADGTARLWDLTQVVEPTVSGEPLSGHTGSMRDVAFSPNGRTLATANDDDTVMLWDVTIEDSIRRICASTQGVLTPREWEQTLPGQSYQPPCS
jgi:WD40 repeat protein